MVHYRAPIEWWLKPSWVINEKHWKNACREVAKLVGETDPYPISITALPVRDYDSDPFDIKNGGCFADTWTLEIEGVPCRIAHSAGSWKGETYHYYKHKMKNREEVMEWLKTVGVPNKLNRTYNPYEPRTEFGLFGPHEPRQYNPLTEAELERPRRPRPRGPMEILE